MFVIEIVSCVRVAFTSISNVLSLIVGIHLCSQQRYSVNCESFRFVVAV